MSPGSMSLKARIRNLAKQKNVAAQVVLQNYMFERFLDRLSRSDYKNKFVLKGGMLIASLVGLDTRSTMDLDMTLRNLSLTADDVRSALNAICSMPVEDEVTFSVGRISPIRTTQEYHPGVLQEAITATAKHRGTLEQIADKDKLLSLIAESPHLKDYWGKYQKQFAYAEDISFEQVIETISTIVPLGKRMTELLYGE